MPSKRTSFELTVERPTPGIEDGPPGIARLSARFDAGPDAREPTREEVAEALRALDQDLEFAIRRLATPSRPDRPLEELVETYRPRQLELVELLRADGEISESEYALLRPQLERPPPRGRVEEVETPIAATASLAALPLANDHTPTTPRPVPELLKTFQITTLKQAGAVRARRQISFAEYMSLKRHFSEPERPLGPEAPRPDS